MDLFYCVNQDGEISKQDYITKVKIESEMLEKTGNFPMQDDLDMEKYIEVDLKEDLPFVKDSDFFPPTGKVLSSATESVVREYIDLEEYLRALSNGRLLMCSTCRIDFPVQEKFNAYMIYHGHGKLLLCDICKRQFSRSATRKDHILMNFGLNRYICGYCNFRFPDKKVLKSHMITVHFKIRPIESKACNKELAHKQSSKDHSLVHKNSKPFERAPCKKRFIRLSSLRAYMIVRAAEVPYLSDICYVGFKRSPVLKTPKLTRGC